MVREFTEWLRRYNTARDPGDPEVGFYGLDLYSMYGSIAAVRGSFVHQYHFAGLMLVCASAVPGLKPSGRGDWAIASCERVRTPRRA